MYMYVHVYIYIYIYIPIQYIYIYICVFRNMYLLICLHAHTINKYICISASPKSASLGALWLLPRALRELSGSRMRYVGCR